MLIVIVIARPQVIVTVINYLQKLQLPITEGEGRDKGKGGMPPNANSWSHAAALHVYNTTPSIPAYVHAAC